MVLKRLITLYEALGQSDKAEPLVLELRQAYPAHLQLLQGSQLLRADDEITDEAIENEGAAIFNFVLAHQSKYPILGTYAYDNALRLKTVNYASSADRLTKPLSETALLDSRAKDIRRVLKPGEATVEFVSFRQYTNRWTDTTLYAAIVLRHGDPQVRMIRLCTGNQLRNLTNGYRLTPEQGINRLYTPRGAKVKTDTATAISGAQLYQLIWKPIEGWLKGIKTVYFAPAGELNKVAFAALPLSSKTGSLQPVLADSVRLRQLVATSSVIQLAPLFITKTDSIVLLGGIQYAVDSLKLSQQPRNPSIAVPRLPIAGQGAIKPLPGTTRELAAIRPLFTNAQSFTGLKATEAAVKQRTPKVLHIATHGFYFPQLTPIWHNADNSERLDQKSVTAYGYVYAPLLRSGLLMAGASHVWGGGQPIRGLDDGILTAYEIASLSLARTRLVVLSACETALGDVRGNETLLGFQRAFKTAGVQNLLVSLWQVPDVETAEFMQRFYSNCLNERLPVSDAFQQTQMAMRRKYPDQPFKWAAFMLLE